MSGNGEVVVMHVVGVCSVLRDELRLDCALWVILALSIGRRTVMRLTLVFWVMLKSGLSRRIIVRLSLVCWTVVVVVLSVVLRDIVAQNLTFMPWTVVDWSFTRLVVARVDPTLRVIIMLGVTTMSATSTRSVTMRSIPRFRFHFDANEGRRRRRRNENGPRVGRALSESGGYGVIHREEGRRA